MNILIIPAFFQTKEKPTQGSFFIDQALALQRAGHKVVILYADTYSVKCMGDWIDYKEDKVEIIEGIKIYRNKVFCPLKHGIEGHREVFVKVICELFDDNIKGKLKIDIIHAHCCVWAGYAAMKLSGKTGIPYVITEHATLFKLHPDRIVKSNEKCIDEAFRKASKVICVSSEFRKLISRYRDVDDIEVIGNVVDCELFKPMENENTRKQTDTPTFLTVCYMETEDQLYKKGIDVLLKAWKNVLKVYPKAKIIIGGGGHAQLKVLEWCKEYEIINNVKIVGALDRAQVVEYMNKCDFFVLPSRYETFGVVYIEAMACGKPVIAARNGGPDDFIHDFNGTLVESEDVEGLTKAICDMICTREKYDSQTIVKYVEQNFSSKAIAERLENIYSGI